MRIAVVSTTTVELPPRGYGGEIYFFLLAKRFRELSHEVTLYAPPKSEPPEGVELRYIRHTYGNIDLQAEASVWKRYGDEILEHDIILDCSHNHFPAENIYYFHPEHKDKVFNVLNGIVSTTPRPPYNLSVGSQSWKECLIKGISQFHGTFWSKLYGDRIPSVRPEAIRAVISWAIDVESYPFTTDKEDYWLFFSRCTPYKGLHNFIKLARLNPDDKFVISYNLALEDHRYWHERYKPAIESTDNIELVLDPTPEQKKELMANAKGFLFPHSNREPFGLVPIEAMACGTPVIATALGALTETVREGGILCRFNPKKRMVDLEDAMRAMERIDAGEVKPRDARRNAEEYDYRRVVPKYLEVFNNTK